jgi:sugar/nucleoside kinase (ribokinase family)
MADQVELAKAIKSLRRELMDAMKDGAEEDLRFGLGPIEVEFELAATSSREANAGVKFYVVDIGAKGASGMTATHRIKLNLVPVTAAGGDVKVVDVVGPAASGAPRAFE